MPSASGRSRIAASAQVGLEGIDEGSEVEAALDSVDRAELVHFVQDAIEAGCVSVEPVLNQRPERRDEAGGGLRFGQRIERLMQRFYDVPELSGVAQFRWARCFRHSGPSLSSSSRFLGR